MKADITVSITYNLTEPSKTKIQTNATREGLEELLEAYISTQIGQGEDKSIANEKDEYHIVIGIDMEDDRISVKSDTGNKGLTCGLVMDVLGKLDSIKINDN